jgi:hypothetical protein
MEDDGRMFQQDSVEYHIFFDAIPVDPSQAGEITTVDPDTYEVPAGLPDAPRMTVANYLLMFRSAFFAYLEPIMDKYQWVNQPFSLDLWFPSAPKPAPIPDLSSLLLSPQSSSPPPALPFPPVPHLTGTLNLAPAFVDEWMTVYLLLALSARFPFISIRLTEGDTQFLLAHCPVTPLW